MRSDFVKKIISLMLALSLLFMVGSFSFAQTDDIEVSDPMVPGAPAQSVTGDMYDEEIEDDGVPGGASDTSVRLIEIEDEEPPKADALPQTGGIPAGTFYAAGALLIIAALIISVKKSPAR